MICLDYKLSFGYSLLLYIWQVEEEPKIMARIMITAGRLLGCIGVVLYLLTLIMNCKCVIHPMNCYKIYQ